VQKDVKALAQRVEDMQATQERTEHMLKQILDRLPPT
jgi:hypothetical protein